LQHRGAESLVTRKLICLSALILCLPQTSFAYVDPGTGAYVVQALVALAGATIFYITHPLELLRRVKTKLLKRKDAP
jgi:hypothetical protein